VSEESSGELNGEVWEARELISGVSVISGWLERYIAYNCSRRAAEAVPGYRRGFSKA
jgi:hypothetical protein